MPRLLTVIAALFALFAVACGGGGDDDAGESTATATATTSPAGSSTTQAAPTPSAAQIEEILKLSIAGYTASDSSLNPLGGSVTHTATAKTAGGASLLVRAQIAQCDAFICGSLDPKTYESVEAQRNLKSILPSAHIENPALRWEFGAVQLSATARGLYYFAQSYLETKGADGSVTRSSANSYRAWYHNGGTLVSLDVFARSSESILSQADLEKRMTKAEAEKAAKDVFAAIEPRLPK